VHASTKTRFEDAYRDIADRLELPGRENPKSDILRLVRNWLCDETKGQWIMILDNVDDVETFFPSQQYTENELLESSPASLAASLPQSRNGSILITSRSKDAASRVAGGHKNIKEVRAMDANQGLQLLQNKLNDSSTEGAVDLLRALDYIPLAITQAAAYINRRARMTISAYLSEFLANDKKRESLINQDAGDLRRDESASNSVVLTWQMSFERIRQERSSATDLLSLMSFFNPQGIPEPILRKYIRDEAELGCADRIDSAFDEDLDTLQAYSLITATAKTDSCEMHALVQFCTQIWLSSFSDVEQWQQKFIKLMVKEFPPPIFRNWTECRQLLPHVESLYEMKLSGDDSVTEWAQVLRRAGRYLEMAQGKYDAAERLYRRALEGCEKELGEQHLSMLTSKVYLASVLWKRGEYDEAEKLNRQALEGREKELGIQHPETLTSVSNLALVLRYQGKYSEAEKLHRRALDGMEKELGAQHPDTLTSVSNLASVLQDRGKYDEAEKLNRQALEGRKKELGGQHPDTLISTGNLASILELQGKYDEAEPLIREVLKQHEKELGIRHPHTLTSVSKLASVVQRQGKYDEAEKLSRQALEGLEKELGVQHPDTLTSVSNLASVLQRQGKYDEAEKLNRRALEGREKKLGVRHPDTLDSVYNLAYHLHKQKRYDEATELYQRVCHDYKQTLGSQHPHTIACLSNFRAMQEEADPQREWQHRMSIKDDKAAPRDAITYSVNNLNNSEGKPEPAGQKSKRGSIYTRLKDRMRRKGG
jgi:tetratricopeptide (TPR) repeat protein